MRRNDAITRRRGRRAGARRRSCSRPGPARRPRPASPSPLIRRWGATIPMLGVCLGHQAIGEAYGGRVVRAGRVMHGKTSRIVHDGTRAVRGPAAPAAGDALPLAHRRAGDAARLRSRRGRRRATTERRSTPCATRASGVGRAVPSRVGPDARRQGAAAQLPRRSRGEAARLLAALLAPAMLGAQDVGAARAGPRTQSPPSSRSAASGPHGCLPEPASSSSRATAS